MIVEASRLLVTLTTTALGFLVGRSTLEWFPSWATDRDLATVTGALIGAGVGYVVGGVVGRLLRRGLDRAPELLAGASGPELFAGAFGSLVGLVMAAVFAVPLAVLLPPLVGWPLASMVALVGAAFGARVFAARSHELLAAAGLRTADPLRTTTVAEENGGTRRYLIDSAAAIDGRVLELTRSGLLAGNLWVPEFVVDELQGIADARDRSRRRRGRRGLDVLDAVRSVPGVEFAVLEESVPEHTDVDAKLVALAARTGATLVTSDHNLAQAAELRGILVLNPHALGESMRPSVVAGDRIEITIEKEGSEPGQGVGYLDDGTMVVLEGGSEHIGDTLVVEVSNSLRTSVGRLLFAKLAG